MTHWRKPLKQEDREAIYGWSYLALILVSLAVLISFALGRVI